MENSVYKILEQDMRHRDDNTKVQPVTRALSAQKSAFEYKDSLYTVHKKTNKTKNLHTNTPVLWLLHSFYLEPRWGLA